MIRDKKLPEIIKLIPLKFTIKHAVHVYVKNVHSVLILTVM